MNANYKSIILAISLLFALSASLSAAPGDLDPTFGNGGIAITSGEHISHLNAALGMAIQMDGKIVVVGDGATSHTPGVTWDFAVARFNTDGSLDTTFGFTGIVITPVGNSHDNATSVAIQADGKIVVAGTICNGVGDCGNAPGSSLAVVRYNPNGSLDTSFNGTGIVITSANSYPWDLAIQADGKIVVAGGNALIRYNPNGSLDASFNGTGIVLTQVSDPVASVAIQSDEKIVVAGGRQNSFAVVRYNTDGSPDTSFNGTGIVLTPVGNSSSASDLAIQSNGKIVVAGESQNSFAVVRYNRDGSLDTSFSGSGMVATPVGSSCSGANSVRIQSDGKIVAAGYSCNGTPSSGRSDFAVVRYNPNGSLDTRFNGTGKVITQIYSGISGSDYAASVAIQADGKIVAAGPVGYDWWDFVVVRYQGDATTPTACPNPIDCTDFFVRQHYLDFLGREPDAIGFQNWLNTLLNCPNGGFGEFDNPNCDRVHVSAAFYQSHEFQGRGYWLLRFSEVGLDRRTTYAEFVSDLQQIGGAKSPVEEAAAKIASTNAFVQRPEFQNRYAGFSHAQYVNALEQNAGVSLSNKQELIDSLNAGTRTRAEVLRNVVESQVVFDKFIISGFVTMQYFGYLHRDPDTIGYQNWVETLTANPGDFRHMIFGFIYSTEYRTRFGPQ